MAEFPTISAPVRVVEIVTRETPIHGRVTVTTPGTRVRLSVASVPLPTGVTVKANAANTHIIYVGGSGVSSANGFELNPGDAQFFDYEDLNAIWIDAQAGGGGEGITYIA